MSQIGELIVREFKGSNLKALVKELEDFMPGASERVTVDDLISSMAGARVNGAANGKASGARVNGAASAAVNSNAGRARKAKPVAAKASGKANGAANGKVKATTTTTAVSKTRAKRMNAEERSECVLKVVSGGTKKMGEIVAKSKLTPTQVRSALIDLRQHGKVRMTGERRSSEWHAA